jgi:hypothetical protein
MMAYVISGANQITCSRVTQLNANNTNPVASRHESARWWAAVPSLVNLHGKPCDGKHQPLGAQMLFYFTLLPSNHIMFFNPRILDQTTLFPLAATKSSLDFRQTKPCFGSEIKPNLVGTCIQKRFDDALEHVLHRVSHTVSFCLWSSSSHLELIQSLTFLH